MQVANTFIRQICLFILLVAVGCSSGPEKKKKPEFKKAPAPSPEVKKQRAKINQAQKKSLKKTQTQSTEIANLIERNINRPAEVKIVDYPAKDGKKPARGAIVRVVRAKGTTSLSRTDKIKILLIMDKYGFRAENIRLISVSK